MRLRREIHSYVPWPTTSASSRRRPPAGARSPSAWPTASASTWRSGPSWRGSSSARGAREPHQGLLHALLARTEERLAATLDAHAERSAGLRETLRVLERMLDRLTLLYLTHTPEIPPERREEAVALAKRRYLKWRHAVEEQGQSGGGNGEGAEAVAAGQPREEG